MTTFLPPYPPMTPSLAHVSYLIFRVLPLSMLMASPFAVGKAQERPPTPAPASSSVPAHMTPPEGMCRIWIGGVAPAQQPAPTDCQTALRQRPTNGTVIFGPAKREPEQKGFSTRPRPSRTDSAGRRPAPTRTRSAPSSRPASDSTARGRSERPEQRKPAERPS